MIDALYNYRQGEIHSAEFSDDFNKLCIPFENSLSEEQIDLFHKLLDCVSETAAAEMRAAYKVGFKDCAMAVKSHIISALHKLLFVIYIEVFSVYIKILTFRSFYYNIITER